MTPSDEKELVLGNKQLISLFFVVAALCGVFFAVGYIVGRNSTKANIAGLTDSAGAASAATVARQQPEPPRETAPAALDTTSSAPVEPAPAQVETHPAQDSGASTPSEAPKEVKAAKPANVAVSAPETGASYLQVTALPRSDADNMVRSLREQSFPAIVAASSKDGLFRVLVGPYHETPQIADAKNRLKSLGFANTFVQKQ